MQKMFGRRGSDEEEYDWLRFERLGREKRSDYSGRDVSGSAARFKWPGLVIKAGLVTSILETSNAGRNFNLGLGRSCAGNVFSRLLDDRLELQELEYLVYIFVYFVLVYFML
ncbi:hypothetical protein OROHE_008184 [Orobanche hederae]